MAVQNLSNLNSDGTLLGQTASDNIAFYGGTPTTRRAAAAQATSLLSTASSATIDTATKAAIIEIMNTLAALGLWKGSA